MKNTFKFSIFLFLALFLNPLFAQIQNPRKVAYHFKTDTTKKIINLSEIILVLPRASFPSIDTPAFVNKKVGLKMFFKTEPVLAVEIGGKSKAYPLNMLSFHEISNDVLSGIPILPSYCPLCNSAVVYDRRSNINGKPQVLSFEVSGMLRFSGMVILDKETETWWQQSMGKALVGELAGTQLKTIPSLVLSVEEYFKNFPQGLILSKETGYPKIKEEYGKNVYKKYDSIGHLPYAHFFKAAEIDPRLPAMERIVDVSDGHFSKIYPFSILRNMGVVNDHFKTKDLVIFYEGGALSHLDNYDLSHSKEVGTANAFNANLDGDVLIFKKEGADFIDMQTYSKWSITGRCLSGKLKGKQLQIESHSNHFAFSWLKFHPKTEIYTHK